MSVCSKLDSTGNFAEMLAVRKGVDCLPPGWRMTRAVAVLPFGDRGGCCFIALLGRCHSWSRLLPVPAKMPTIEPSLTPLAFG